MTVDGFATQFAYLDHIRPVWEALPEVERGTLWCGTRVVWKYALRLGLDATLGNPRMPGPPVLLAGHSDYTQAHPERPVIYLEHGAGQSYRDFPYHSSYPGGTQRGRIGLFLVPGPRSAALERERYPTARVEIVGCPRLDAVIAFPATRHPDALLTVAFANHWDCPIVPETRWAWPVWRDTIGALHRAGEFQVIGTAHPRQSAHIAQWYEKAGIEFVPDSLDVLRRADVVAFDNTSLGFEAMACGLGVVALNAPYYRRDVEHGLRFWDLPPIQLWPGDDLAPAIRRAAAPAERASNVEASYALYPPETRGRSADLAVAAILDFTRGAP